MNPRARCRHVQIRDLLRSPTCPSLPRRSRPDCFDTQTQLETQPTALVAKTTTSDSLLGVTFAGKETKTRGPWEKTRFRTGGRHTPPSVPLCPEPGS